MVSAQYILFFIFFHSGIIFNSPKQKTTQISISGRMDQQWYIYTMEYSIAMKMNELQLHSTMPLILTNIMLGKKKRKPTKDYDSIYIKFIRQS